MGCWNCSGIKSNFVYVRRLLENFDILALSEHWLYADELPFLDSLHNQFDNYAKVSNGNEINTRWKRGQGGVAIFWRKRFKVQRLALGSDRIAAVRIGVGNQSYVFCSVYFPSTNSSLADFRETLCCLETICINFKYSGEKIVIAGDFNAHLCDLRSNQPENNRGRLVKDIFAGLDMFPVNVDLACTGSLFTYLSSRGNSVVDYLFMNESMRSSIQHVKVIEEHPCNSSYHLPLTVHINIYDTINYHRPSSIPVKEYERIAWNKCMPEQIQEYQRRLCVALTDIDDISLITSEDVENYNLRLCTAIKTSDQCLPRVVYKKFIKPYWNDELRNLKSTCMECHRKWILDGRPRGDHHESFRVYKNAKRLFRKEQRRLAMQAEENDFKELSDASEIDNTKFWKYVNRRRKKKVHSANGITVDGKFVTDPEKIAESWASYYQNLLAPEENIAFNSDFKEFVENEIKDISRKSVTDIDDILRDPISTSELGNVVSMLPNNKAPGDDGIVYENIKYSGGILIEKLAILYNKIVELEYIPKQFKLGIKISIPKGGKTHSSKFDDHRGITLLCSFNKVFERLVLNRIQSKIRCHPHGLQGAYQSEQDALTTSFVIDESIKHCCEDNDKVYACYVDVSKAFDKLWIDGMLFKLYYHAKIKGKCWRLIKNWYSGMVEYVYYNGIRSRSYAVLQGTRQGGVLSPWLFLLFIDDLIKELESLSVGITMYNSYVGSPMFADDLTMMSRLKNGLDAMLVQLHEYSLRWRLTFNKGKTVVLTFGEGRKNSLLNTQRKWSIGDNEIAEKKVWCNLGKIWHVDTKSQQPFLEAARSGQNSGIGLANMGCRINGINPLVAIKLWKRIGLPKMLYGAELWKLNRTGLQKMEKVQNTFVRICLGLLSGTSGSAARGLLGVWTVEAEIDKRKLMFLRRLASGSEHSTYRRIFMLRLIRWKWNPQKITGFVPGIVMVLGKYDMWRHMDEFLKSGYFPSKSEWKRLVTEAIRNSENIIWMSKIQSKPALELYQYVVKELAPSMWLKLAHENSSMIEHVSTIVKVLCGSFLVGGVRFNGNDKEIFCNSCGRNFKNLVKHAMLYCQETVAIRERFWEWLTDCLPIEISAKLNMLDDDSLLYTLFGDVGTLQEYHSDLLKQFYFGVGEYISETIKTVSYIDSYL